MLLAAAVASAQASAPKAQRSGRIATAQEEKAQANLTARLQEADKLAAEGNLVTARAAYEKAILAGAKLEKDFVRAHTLGLCYLNGQPADYGKAVSWLQTALQLNPVSEDARNHLAQAYQWSGQAEPAAVQYGMLYREHPSSTDYLLGLTNSLYAKGDKDEAITRLEQFVERFPSNVEARLQLARFLAYSQKFTTALVQFQAVLQIQPGDSRAEVGIAKVQSWQGQNDVALTLYDKVLRQHPNDLEATVGKAFSLLWLDRRDEARDLFLSAQKRLPKDRDIAAALKALGPKLPPKAPPVQVADSKLPESVVPTPKPEVPAAVPVYKEERAEPAAPPPAPAPDPYSVAMRSAEESAAASDYTQAVHYYHEALAVRPDDKDALWQLARVLSWSKAYGASIAEYDKVIAAHPKALLAQMERARVSSWDKNYDTALSGYKGLLTQLATCGPDCDVKGVTEKDVRVEYARVLAWAKRYDEAISEYSTLLPAQGSLQESDRAAGLDYGRVLAWSRRYNDAIGAFDRVIALGGGSYDARLAKAQVLFWSGRLSEAQQSLRRLHAERPKDPELNLTLASVEHAMGYNARSLALLTDATPGKESDDIRHSISEEMRPLLRFRYGFENDQGFDAGGSVTAIKVLRYSTAVEFNLNPDLRMEVENTISHGLTSNPALAKHSPTTLSSETLARLRFKVTPWLALTAGAGLGVSGGNVLQAPFDRRYHFVFDVHPVITHRNLRIDLAVGRHTADYTPLATNDNVIQTRFTTTVNYRIRKRVGVGAEYWHGLYNVESPEPGLPTRFTTEGNGGSAWILPTWIDLERFKLEAGMRYDSFGFDEGALRISAPAAGIPASGVGPGISGAGFFTPRLYQRYAGDIRMHSDLPQAWVLAAHGTIGPQRIFGFAPLSPPPASWGATGSVGAEVSKAVKSWRYTLAYVYFTTETPSSPGLTTGSYKSHAVTFVVTKRF